jgi:hypothetical protein
MNVKPKSELIPGYSIRCPDCGVTYRNSSEGVVRQNYIVHRQAAHPEEWAAANAETSERRRGKKAASKRVGKKTSRATRHFKREKMQRWQQRTSISLRNPHPSEPKTPILEVNA